MTAQASRHSGISRRDAALLAGVLGTILVVLLIAATRGVADGDPHEIDGRATSSAVVAPKSTTTLTARCPAGHFADRGTVEVRPGDASVAGTAGMARPGSARWTVRVVSRDPRPVSVVAAVRCEPLDSLTGA